MLTINVDKTYYIYFSIRQAGSISWDLQITSHHCLLEDSCEYSSLGRNSLKYLGVTLDNRLNFKDRIKILYNKVRKLVYVLKNLGHVADPVTPPNISDCTSRLPTAFPHRVLSAGTTLKALEVAQRELFLKSACM